MVIVWQYVHDLAARRRLRTTVRFAALAIGVLLVALGWWGFGPPGGLVAVLVLVTMALLVEAWGRSTPAAGTQRIWLDDGHLVVEGPDVYRRGPDDDGFDADEDDEPVGDERDHEVSLVVGPDDPTTVRPAVALDEVAWASVYPATTRTDDAAGPAVGHHLVVDLGLRDGSRCCLVFDRRIPFRLSGELALVDAMAGLVGDRWREPPDDDPFGEVDRRRLGDWRAVSR